MVRENNTQVDHINMINLPESNHKEIPTKCTVVLLTLTHTTRQLGTKPCTGLNTILQANDNEEDLANIKWPKIKSRLKSRGIQLVTRGAKMPWVMGGAESANKMVKCVLPSNKKISLFQLNGFLEYAMYTINCRPIGVSTSSEAVCPGTLFQSGPI